MSCLPSVFVLFFIFILQFTHIFRSFHFYYAECTVALAFLVDIKKKKKNVDHQY